MISEEPPRVRTQTSGRRAGAGECDPVVLGLRQISHDIHHELGTILILASLLSDASTIDADSKLRARQIQGEVRWLEELHRAYEQAVGVQSGQVTPAPPDRIRLDTLVGEVVTALQLSTFTRITFSGTEAWARLDRLACWRALRNIIGNALRAAGDRGRVEVRVCVSRGRAVAEIEDDGPGLDAVPVGLDSLGLGIAHHQTAMCGGWLEIGRGRLGGCRVLLSFPTAVPDPPA
jgi:signal transduction histidine kinase